jgi:hypothetical protein
VSSARQEQLNNQARAIMYDLSSTVLSGQAALRKPAPYLPTEMGSGTEGERKRIDNGSAGFAVPPVIPPPGGIGSGSSGSSLSSGSTSHITPMSPTTSIPTGAGPTNVGSGGGPVLGGAGSAPVVSPPGPGLPIPAPSPSHPGISPGIIGPLGTPGALPTTSVLPNGTKLPMSNQLKPGTAIGPSGRMTIPSGGVIGATPGSGMIGQMPAGTPDSRAAGSGRANPLGGVIGQQGGVPSTTRGGVAGKSGMSTHGMPQSSLVGSQGRGRGQHQADSEQRHWDPDNPWATEEGVSPVLLPPENQGPIDPGPAIGYSR